MTSSLRYKSCSVCNGSYQEDFFHKNKATKDGLHTLCKTCNKKKAAKWKKENPERARGTDYRRKYGIDYETYTSLLTQQEGSCAICKAKSSESLRGLLFVDHCHKTGKVRGLLCQNCNTAIGLLQDNPSFCITAAHYLIKEVDNA